MSSSNKGDSSVLGKVEQTMRPRDDALHQQRIEGWSPILDPVWVIVPLLCLGVILVPVGRLRRVFLSPIFGRPRPHIIAKLVFFYRPED